MQMYTKMSARGHEEKLNVEHREERKSHLIMEVLGLYQYDKP